MKDLLLTADGDLDLSSGALQLVDGAARVAQQVRTRLRSYLGEWDFDLDYGVPWFQSILGIKGVSLNDVDTVLQAQILAVADVNSILTWAVDFDRDARTLSIAASIDTTFGPVTVGGSFP